MATRAPGRDVSGLQRRLGHAFRAPALLGEALTHTSFSRTSYERLEFLGDALLGGVISTILYERFPARPEGDLTRMRAVLVREATLAEIALSLDLGAELLMGKGELQTGGYRRPSILADALEAVLAAVYLDGGPEALRRVVEGIYGDRIAGAADAPTFKDSKTTLQERVQGLKHPLPVYRLIAAPVDGKGGCFQVGCLLERLGIEGVGEGLTRQVAEFKAAEKVLAELDRARPRRR